MSQKTEETEKTKKTKKTEETEETEKNETIEKIDFLYEDPSISGQKFGLISFEEPLLLICNELKLEGNIVCTKCGF